MENAFKVNESSRDVDKLEENIKSFIRSDFATW